LCCYWQYIANVADNTTIITVFVFGVDVYVVVITLAVVAVEVLF
jgi:hypothetical protein